MEIRGTRVGLISGSGQISGWGRIPRGEKDVKGKKSELGGHRNGVGKGEKPRERVARRSNHRFRESYWKRDDIWRRRPKRVAGKIKILRENLRTTQKERGCRVLSAGAGIREAD